MRTTCGIHTDKRHKKHKTTFNSGSRNRSASQPVILHTTLGTEHSNLKKKNSLCLYIRVSTQHRDLTQHLQSTVGQNHTCLRPATLNKPSCKYGINLEYHIACDLLSYTTAFPSEARHSVHSTNLPDTVHEFVPQSLQKLGFTHCYLVAMAQCPLL